MTAAEQMVQHLVNLARSGSDGACKMNLTLLSTLLLFTLPVILFQTQWAVPFSQRCAVLYCNHRAAV
jgi:hypothetical protein